jgi:hypothetical protein
MSTHDCYVKIIKMRNKLAGTKTGTSKTAKYYHDNPEARKKKLAYDSKYQDTHGNGDGKDVAHTSKTKTRMQSQSKNRADKKRSFFKS